MRLIITKRALEAVGLVAEEQAGDVRLSFIPGDEGLLSGAATSGLSEEQAESLERKVAGLVIGMRFANAVYAASEPDGDGCGHYPPFPGAPASEDNPFEGTVATAEAHAWPEEVPAAKGNGKAKY